MATVLRYSAWVVFALLLPVSICYSAPFWLHQEEGIRWPSTFLPVSIAHVTLIWIVNLAACRVPNAKLASDTGAELVRLSGYLYTLLALVMVLQTFGKTSDLTGKAGGPAQALLEGMLPLLGAGLYSSLLGWFFAPFIELWSAAPLPGKLQPLETELIRLLQDNTKPSIDKFNEVIAEAARQIAASTKNLPEIYRFLSQAADLQAKVQLLIETDVSRRERLEEAIRNCQLEVARLSENYR